MATEAFLHDVTAQAREAMESLLSQAKCKPGDLVVVGLSLIHISEPTRPY